MAGFKPRRDAVPHNGQINLFTIPPFDRIFMSRSGHVWSTARAGLRQRRFTKWKGLLVLRVSGNGHAHNWLVDSLTHLAMGWGRKVHWNGTKIDEGWIPAVGDTEGVGPAAKVVDDAPRV